MSGRGWGLLVHEYMHEYLHMNHTKIIEDNDVPFVVPPPGEKGHAACGYNMMCGTNASPNKSNYNETGGAMSAWERRRAGWLDPEVIDATAASDASGLTVGDFYLTGDTYYFPLKAGSAADTLVLENRQRRGYFNQRTYDYSSNPDYDVIVVGLKTTGLLATLSRGNPNASYASGYAYDPLLADNEFEFVSECIGSADNCFGLGLYDGDLYGPDTQRQISPWTRPNVSGYTYYPSGFEPNWFAIDDIRYVASDPDSTMAFDFYADFRTAPTVVIRADSWMGAETAFAFSSEVRVTAGSTLTIEDGADVTFDGGLTVEDGGALVIEPGAAFAVGENTILLAESGGSVVVAPGAEITVESGAVVRGVSGAQLTVGAGATVRLGEKARVEASALTAVGTEAEPILFTRSNPGDDVWDRVLLTNGPDFAHDLQHVRIEGAAVGLDVQARGSSPGAAGAVLTNVRLVGNDIGLSTDYHDCGGWCFPQRARVWMNHVLVEESNTYGLYLRNADFELSESTVRAGGGHGVFVKNATATAFFDNVIEDNGTNVGSYDGLRVEANGWIDFSGRGDVVGTGQPGRNRIARNDDHQVAYLPGSYLFMGAAGLGGDLNTVTERGTGCHVYNDSGSILEAENNYWGTTSAPPAGYFCGSYSVDANPYLTADSTGGSGGGYRPAPGGDVLLATAGTTAGMTAANRGGDDDPIAVLRARIQVVRAAITESPSAEAASALVRLLAGLHRLDTDDATGEAVATEQVLRTLRDHLTAAGISGEGHPESLPPGLRRAAESAAANLPGKRSDCAR